MSEKCYIVAELSANHGHSLEIAKESIRAVARCGADAVKLQTYTPDSLTLPVRTDDFLLKGGLWDGRYLHDLYKEGCTPYEWHAELFATAREAGIECFSTPFDCEAVDLLESLNNPIYKIASFEVMDRELIRYAASKGRPMVISTGIASDREIREAIATCHEVNNYDITLLKCTSAYPARIEDASLGLIPEMRERYGVKIGLSDHSEGTIVAQLGVAVGITMVEKHFILDRSIGGPDASFSMDLDGFTQLVKDIRTAESVMNPGSGIPEDEDLSRAGRQWGRSLYVSAPIAAGEPFTRDNVRCVRPGYSLHPRHLEDLLGRKASRNYAAGERIPPEELIEN
jgi:pseudaminic acid synthase